MSTSLDIARPIFHGTRAVIEIRFPNRQKLIFEKGRFNDEDEYSQYLIGLAQEIKYKKQNVKSLFFYIIKDLFWYNYYQFRI